MDDRTWWARVPKSVRPRLTFVNRAVNASVFESTLLSTVTPEDYVVVKLDIDTPVVESAILDRIEAHADLIDELFFEWHFWFDGMNFGWGTLDHLRTTTNVSTVVRRMQRLRRAGIRAHFWV